MVNQLARILTLMLEKNLNGLYHAVGPQAISKYMFGVEIARKFGFNQSLISPKSVSSSGLTAKRSQNLSLSIHKLSTDLGQPLPEFFPGLDEFYEHEGRLSTKIRSFQQA
jgi:dTDP-4-dehydrorhamnose reductase